MAPLNEGSDIQKKADRKVEKTSQNDVDTSLRDFKRRLEEESISRASTWTK